MSISANNKLIALYSDTGYVYIGSIDLNMKHTECFTNIKDSPVKIAW